MNKPVGNPVIADLSQQFAEAISFNRKVMQYSAMFAESFSDIYARRQQSQSPELFDDAGQARWIQIGGEMGADGHRHGGHPVKIDSYGKMLSGHFAGQTMGQAFGATKESEENSKATQKVASAKAVTHNDNTKKAISELLAIGERTKRRSANRYDVDKSFAARQVLFDHGWSSQDIEDHMGATKSRHQDLLEKAAMYRQPGENYNRNIAAPANRLQDAIDRGHPPGSAVVNSISDELQMRLKHHGQPDENDNQEAQKHLQEMLQSGKSMVQFASEKNLSPRQRKALFNAFDAHNEAKRQAQQQPSPARAAAMQKAQQPKPGITIDTRANESAKTGDQMGLFGDVANVPKGKATLDKTGESKGHQTAMFDTKGDPDQMLMFDDGVTPEDRLMPEVKAKPFEPTILGKKPDSTGPKQDSEPKEAYCQQFTPVLLDRYSYSDDLRLDDDTVDRYEWNEAAHPRNPAGNSIGGRFRSTKLRDLPHLSMDAPRIDQSHHLHHNKLPPDLQQAALNWSAKLHELVGNPMNTNYHEQVMRESGKALTPEQVQMEKERRWAQVDKNQVRQLLDQMNKMDKTARAHGIDLAGQINANKLIPRDLAERLSGGSRFFDPSKIRPSAGQQSPQGSQQQLSKAKSWKDDPAAMKAFMARKGISESTGERTPEPEMQGMTKAAMMQPGPQPAKQAEQPPKPKPDFAKENAISKQAAGKVDRVAADTVGDGDQSKIDHFKGLIMDAWKQAREAALEHNEALRSLQGLAGGRNFSANFAQHLAKGGDADSIKGFDEVVDHARRHFPHLVGGADNAESGVIDLFRKGVQVAPQPWHDSVVDQAVQMAPRGFFDEYVPSAAEHSDHEHVPFSVVHDCRRFVQAYWLRGLKDYYALRHHPMHAAKPTEAQKEAGNYRMSHVKIHGLDITIETPKGRRRREGWPTMKAHYGYVKRTEGADGDNVDVFLGPDRQATSVWIIDQVKPNGSFDEHKALLGFPSRESAIAAYRGSYSIGWRVGKVTAMTIDEFKNWLKSDTTKPAAA